MRRSSPGFTLLESVVALMILSVGLTAAFAWFDRDVDALRRMDRVALEDVALDVALDHLRTIDLVAEPTGTFTWRGYEVDWTSNVADQRQGKAMIGTRGFHDLTLYRAEIAISYETRLISQRRVLLTTSRLRPDVPLLLDESRR